MSVAEEAVATTTLDKELCSQVYISDIFRHSAAFTAGQNVLQASTIWIHEQMEVNVVYVAAKTHLLPISFSK